jgi:tRNA dimethylallyltransferase
VNTSLGEPVKSSQAAACATRVGFIVGPTGVGKTALAIEIAKRLGAEIVNVDSRQVYRGMDLGTAKPTLNERRRVPHHLIDVTSPDAPLDVVEFARLARTAIAEISARGRPVLAVGGSGLYLRVLRDGIFDGPAASREIRAELLAIAQRPGGASRLHDELSRADPEAARRISPNDLKRIVRALEVFRITGVPISEHQRRHRCRPPEYETVAIGLTLAREQLYEAINRRFDAMVEAGLVDEVRALIERDSGKTKPALDTIGYREIAAFVRGEMELIEAIEQAKRESRRLAKRQFTWFRAEPDIIWIDNANDGASRAFELLERFFAQSAAPAIRGTVPNG